jgi:hypothetical protein
LKSPWFKKLPTEKKVSFIALTAFGLLVIFLTLSSFVRNSKLSHDGVYYVARIDKVASSKNGKRYYIEYLFNNVKYTGSFKPGLDFKPNKEGAFIFIKFLPENPKVHRYLDHGEVSDSLFKTLPPSGWKQLP